jgi:hypothetical protein
MTRMLGATLFATSLLFVSSPLVQGQTAPAGQRPAARTSNTTVPRLLDGKPDMQGYWTNQTFTPLERPAQFKDKEFFTPEEAAAWAKRGIDNIVDQPRGAEVTRDAEIHYDDAIWMLEGYPKGAMLRTSIITDPADGRIPAFNEEGQKRAQERAAARKLVGPFDSAQTRGLSERCIYWAHEGPPILPTGYNSNLQIVQAPQNFVVIPEMMPVARIVPLDGRPKIGSAVRGYRGDSRGRWDGDTMVIETTNYSEKTAWRGASENLKVTERFTMIGPRTIRYRFTVEDPSTWTQPWSGEYEMTRIEGPIFEYACHEGNYGLPSILKGARLAEEAAAKSGGTP